MTKEIWRAAEREVRNRLAAEAPGLTDEQVQAILDRLPLYLDAALRECLAELARQEMNGRQSSDSRNPSGLKSAS